jgi:hypothetical protein
MWVRVVTYDYVFGIPSWAERDRSHLGDRDGYHEFTAEPNTILHLDPEVAELLLNFKWRAVYLPGERLDYVPMLEREKKDEEPKVEEPVRRRRLGPTTGDAVRLIRLWG